MTERVGTVLRVRTLEIGRADDDILGLDEV